MTYSLKNDVIEKSDQDTVRIKVSYIFLLTTPLLIYVAHFVFLRDVWIGTQRAAVGSRRATNLATHLPKFIYLIFSQCVKTFISDKIEIVIYFLLLYPSLFLSVPEPFSVGWMQKINSFFGGVAGEGVFSNKKDLCLQVYCRSVQIE
jgi:hypothetical protein